MFTLLQVFEMKVNQRLDFSVALMALPVLRHQIWPLAAIAVPVFLLFLLFPQADKISIAHSVYNCTNTHHLTTNHLLLSFAATLVVAFFLLL